MASSKKKSAKKPAKTMSVKWKKGSFIGVHNAEMGRCYLMVRDDPYGSGMHSRLWMVLGAGGKILADGKSPSKATSAASDAAAKKKAVTAGRRVCKSMK